MEANTTNPTEIDDYFTTVSTNIAVLQLATYIVVLLIGIPLILGIIHYEHFGVDAQKRSIFNQLISAVFATCGLCVSINGFFLTLRCWIGPLGSNFATLITISRRFFLGCFTLIGLEMLLYKICCHIKPIFVMGLDDNVMTTFVLIWNILFSLLVSNSNWFLMKDGHPPIYNFISGEIMTHSSIEYQ